MNSCGKNKLSFILILLMSIKSLKAVTKDCHSETGRCFWMGSGTATWDDARAACQQNDGDLAVMETAELNDYVKNIYTYEIPIVL